MNIFNISILLHYGDCALPIQRDSYSRLFPQVTASPRVSYSITRGCRVETGHQDAHHFLGFRQNALFEMGLGEA